MWQYELQFSRLYNKFTVSCIAKFKEMQKSSKGHDLENNKFVITSLSYMREYWRQEQRKYYAQIWL